MGTALVVLDCNKRCGCLSYSSLFFSPQVHSATGIFSKEKYSSMTFVCVATSTVTVMCKKDHIHGSMGAD